MSRAFLEALAEHVPDDERVLISSVLGDPDTAGGEMWNVRPWRFGDREPPAAANNYVCVSSFRRAADGRWRRTADLFGRALAFMVDDVGTKVATGCVAGLVPTVVVETSPGNQQWWYLFAAPVTEYELFSRLISAFVQQRLGGHDPGMGGANRVGRLPLGINGKEKYRGADGAVFKCRFISSDFKRRYTLDELVAGFGLTLAAARARPIYKGLSPEEVTRRAAAFEEIKADLSAFGMVLKKHSNHAGRFPILCPWYCSHTGAARTGSYLVEPNEQNNWAGSFVCYHSTTHNDNNHLRDLTKWLGEKTEEMQCAAVRELNRQELTWEESCAGDIDGG